MSRRVVILSHGDRVLLPVLLAALERRGIRPYALVLYPPSALREWRALPWLKRIPTLPLVPLRWLRRRVRLAPGRGTRRRVGRVVITGPLNGRAMENDLRRLGPHVVVPAGCGILSPRVLAIPREGTLVVHPGLLPWVRGAAPVSEAILREVPIGCTAFWADAGIDTGRVIARRLVRVAGGETLEALRAAAIALWGEMAAELIAAARAGSLPAGTEQTARFPLARTGPALAPLVDKQVARGAALAAFERWLPFCDSGLTLPPGVDDRLPVAELAGFIRHPP